MSLAYRLRQFWRLIRAQPLPEKAWTTIETILSPAELALFRQQTVGDRAHGYRVLLTLQEEGEDDRCLLAAALLHDVGKCRMKTTILDRVMGTVGQRLFPRRAAAWGKTTGRGWRRPFVIRRQHALLGATMAEQAGSEATTVRLIRHHQDSPQVMKDAEERHLLERLQWADNQN